MIHIDNWTLCYQAILRDYRTAVADYIRARLSAIYGKGALEEVKKAFPRDQWPRMKENARRLRETGIIDLPIRDDLDILDVNHFCNVFDHHKGRLFPAEATEEPGPTDKPKPHPEFQDLLLLLRGVKSLRDPIAHPHPPDFDYDDATYAIQSARRVLSLLGLTPVASELRKVWRELCDRMNTMERTADLNLHRRTVLDALPIHYLDNAVAKEPGVVVFYLHGLGLDCRDFYPALNSRFRSIAPTLAGFYPGDCLSGSFTLSDHAHLMNTFIAKELEAMGNPQIVVVAGFSTGADLAIEMLGCADWIAGRSVGLLALDCNLNSLTTKLISAHLAGMNADSPLEAIKKISLGAATTGELHIWLAVHDYLFKIFSKLGDRLVPLRDLAAEITDRFPDESLEPFLARVRLIKRQPGSDVRIHCILSDDATHRQLAGSQMARQEGLLLQVAPGADHFDLIEDAQGLEQHVAYLIESLAGPAERALSAGS